MPRRIFAMFWVVPLVLLVRTLAGEAAQTPNAHLLGPWTGAIQILGAELKITVVFPDDTGALAATIDIPQQGATGLKLTNVRREGPAVHFELPAGPGLAVFHGKLDAGTIKGDLTQAGVKGAFTRDVTVKSYDGANHLFIKAVTGSPTEHPTLEKTFVPGVLEEISGWILKRTK